MLQVVYDIWEGKRAGTFNAFAHLTSCQASTQDNVQRSRTRTVHPVLQSHLQLLRLHGRGLSAHGMHAKLTKEGICRVQALGDQVW